MNEVSMKATPEIGPVGTTARVLVGLAMLYIASGSTIPFEPEDAAIGLIALPALVIALGLVARRYANGPIRLTRPLGIAINLGVIAALIANDFTGGGATIFYGTTMLIAAGRGQAGCEATVISNWVLGRDDQIGCPTFAPIDEIEARLRRRATTTEAHELQMNRAMKGELGHDTAANTRAAFAARGRWRAGNEGDLAALPRGRRRLPRDGGDGRADRDLRPAGLRR
jgi:hypothetical protein